ncbi:hypothetical protein BT93_L3567 [Corymbia citriodora subsp. variegata]|uniref:Uncharacterized protein n=1 Tax=Corymbia citriodora subsp. variegata TaxID=360336 RepID=A0A8T0CM82_CORYI|nr:hypothetical protein BT93_L3567 [Corymbia citriodora subsp. variegata]
MQHTCVIFVEEVIKGVEISLASLKTGVCVGRLVTHVVEGKERGRSLKEDSHRIIIRGEREINCWVKWQARILFDTILKNSLAWIVEVLFDENHHRNCLCFRNVKELKVRWGDKS